MSERDLKRQRRADLPGVVYRNGERERPTVLPPADALRAAFELSGWWDAPVSTREERASWPGVVLRDQNGRGARREAASEE